MSQRRRREVWAAGLSILECISCGFSGWILLLVILQVNERVFTDEQSVNVVSFT